MQVYTFDICLVNKTKFYLFKLKSFIHSRIVYAIKLHVLFPKTIFNVILKVKKVASTAHTLMMNIYTCMRCINVQTMYMELIMTVHSGVMTNLSKITHFYKCYILYYNIIYNIYIILSNNTASRQVIKAINLEIFLRKIFCYVIHFGVLAWASNR